VYFEYICWKFAGRLLDRVNTPIRFRVAPLPQISRGAYGRYLAIKNTAFYNDTEAPVVLSLVILFLQKTTFVYLALFLVFSTQLLLMQKISLFNN